MVRTVLFDLDGTLTDPKTGITKSVQQALASFGIHVPDLDMLERFIGPPLLEAFQEFYGLTEQQAHKAIEVYRAYFAVHGIFENVLYKGIPELLEKLQQKGMQLAVATSKPAVYANKILKHFELNTYFQTVSGSELDGRRTDKKEVILHALETLHLENAPRESIVMVGDRSHDIVGANRVGIAGIGVLWGYGSEEELKQAGATAVTRSLEDLYRLITRV